MRLAFLLLLCHIPLQEVGSVLAGDTDYLRAGHRHSKKRRNLIFLDGPAEILVKSLEVKKNSGLILIIILQKRCCFIME